MALGDKLKQARLDKGLTASEVAAVTRMKVQMIDDLEREDFSKVAATIYGKGFIRLYAEQVGLDSAPLIEEYLTRFVDPADGGKKPAKEPVAPVEVDDLDDEESDGDLISRVVSFFKKAPEAEDEESAPEPETEKTYFPPSSELEISEPEPEPEPAVIEEEPAPTVIPRSDPERDLFSMARPEPVVQPEPITQPEPVEQAVELEQSDQQIEQPVEPQEDSVEEESGPAIADILSEKFEVAKEMSLEVWRRFQQIASELVLDLKIESRKLADKLPDIRSLELSWNSIPVLVTLLLIVILLVSGLASMIRRSRVDTEVVEEISVVEQPQEQGLRIVVNPPEPYYK